MRLGAACLAVFGLLAACGGRTFEVDSSNEPTGDGDTTTSGSGGGTQKDGVTGFGDDPVTLGACKLGFDPNADPTRPCPWVAKNRCYDHKLDACACICPQNGKSTTCTSGFDGGPDSHTAVDCY